MEAYNEFRQKMLHKRGRMFKVKNSWGVYDAYKAVRKQGWEDIGKPLTEHEFYSIVRGVNKLLAKEISLGNTVVFPERMGGLELRRMQTGAKMVDGKLKVTYPVDWNNTLKLWYADEEARDHKALVREEDGTLYRVKYCKRKANYENKSFYAFALNTGVRKALKKNLKEGKADSLYEVGGWRIEV